MPKRIDGEHSHSEIPFHTYALQLLLFQLSTPSGRDLPAAKELSGRPS